MYFLAYFNDFILWDFNSVYLLDDLSGETPLVAPPPRLLLSWIQSRLGLSYILYSFDLIVCSRALREFECELTIVVLICVNIFDKGR